MSVAEPWRTDSGGIRAAQRPPSAWTVAPYSEWHAVSRGWWWHLVATVFLFPFWSLVAWTVWQKPGGASLGRRFVISTVLTAASLLVVPLLFIIPWTRRWYWYWRSAQSPPPGKDPNAVLDWVWDRIRSRAPQASAAPRAWGPAPEYAPRPMVRDPWRVLVSDADESQRRFNSWLKQTPKGPGRQHLLDVAEYVNSAAARCHEVAKRAQMIERGIGNRPVLIAQRLEAAEQEALSPQASPAIVERIKSLKSEAASLQRMQGTVSELQADLERLCAQLSALVTRALEMTWITLQPAGRAQLSDDLSRLLEDFDNLQFAFDSLRSISP